MTPSTDPEAVAEQPAPDFQVLLDHAEHTVTKERRREHGQPLGPRAEQTRQRLVASARRLFTERGYVQTTASDIAEAAGCSLATFYAYFADQSDVLRALVYEFLADAARRPIDRWDVTDGRRGLRAMISEYVAMYYEYREFKLLWECAKLVDPAIRQLGLEYTAVYKRRNAESLQAGIAAGLIRSDHSAEEMADALTSMLDRHCFHHIVLMNDDLAAVIRSVSLLTDLWAESIHLVETPPTASPAALPPSAEDS